MSSGRSVHRPPSSDARPLDDSTAMASRVPNGAGGRVGRAGLRERPRRPVAAPRLAGAVAVLGAVGLSGAVATAAPAAPQPTTGAAVRSSAPVPTATAFAAARRYAKRRRGTVAIVTIDASRRLRGLHGGRPYLSASVVKAMMLVAYLDRLERLGAPLTGTARRRLGVMIRRSGNAAATWAYRIVGPGELRRVARRAGMSRFVPAPSWGSSRITAVDQARLFRRIDRLVPERHRPLARELLASIVPSQRWGIPAAAPSGYAILFKGGWRRAGTTGARPCRRSRKRCRWVVHQVAKLESAEGTLSIAVLTSGNPSMRYGTQTIRGVAARLLG